MSGRRGAPQPGNETRRVLLIDDDAGFVESIRAYLRERGYAVDAASNGFEALASLGRGRPDVILLDPRLPGIKGLDLLKHISQADSTIPVLVVTASADNAAAVTALENGAAGYLPKPVRLDYLNHLITLQHK